VTLLRNLAHNEWTDIRRSHVVAERVGSSINTDRYPWLEAELDWRARSIRCFYRDREKVEWDSVGNRLQFSLSPPGEERLVERDGSVPVAAQRAFNVLLDEHRALVEADETVNINESVEENLEQFGYL
jgi:hypothetical protein